MKFLLSEGLTLDEVCSFRLILSEGLEKPLYIDQLSMCFIRDKVNESPNLLDFRADKKLLEFCNDDNYVSNENLVYVKTNKIYYIYVLSKESANWYNCFFKFSNKGLVNYVVEIRAFLLGGTALKSGEFIGFIRSFSDEELSVFKVLNPLEVHNENGFSDDQIYLNKGVDNYRIGEKVSDLLVEVDD